MSITRRTLVELAAENPHPAANAESAPCGAPWWALDQMAAGVEYCDGYRHLVAREGYRHGAEVRKCPCVIARRFAERIGEERKRLESALSRLERSGAEGFEGYDVRRHPQAQAAYSAMRAFSEARPPTENVILLGSLGLGKTHLLLASHFALLEAGVDSRYVRARELDRLFRRAESFDEKIEVEALGKIEQIRQAKAVHLDDLGDVEGDETKKGRFAGAIKELLDTTSAAFAVSTNCTAKEALEHPEIGAKVLNRLKEHAVIVEMVGPSQRRAIRHERPLGILEGRQEGKGSGND